jgi:hypothetical protein
MWVPLAISDQGLSILQSIETTSEGIVADIIFIKGINFIAVSSVVNHCEIMKAIRLTPIGYKSTSITTRSIGSPYMPGGFENHKRAITQTDKKNCIK